MSKTKKAEVLSAIDFFCGAGGVSCGFRGVGIEVLAGIDIDPQFKETYEKNNNTAFFDKDVSNLQPDELKNLFPIVENDDSLIFVGCSPCQYYSNLNSDKTKSKEGRLLLDDFKEFVLYYKPGFVFIENVSGLETKKGSPLSRFKRALKKQGYVFDQKTLNAKYFGIPQNRRRFVLIASRLVNEIKLPKQERNREKIVTVREAIGDLSKFPKVDAGFKDKSDKQHSVAELSEINLKRARKTPKDGGTRLSWANDEKLQLECYKGHKGHTDVYGRMFWDKPSPALTTKFIYTSTGRYTHPEQDRAISLREGATLQTFPYDYVFHSASQGKIATMIGNAVPPKLAAVIGQTIKEYWIKWQNSGLKQEL